MNETNDFGLLNSQNDARYGDRRYGLLGTMAKNGCGIIALYNIERASDEKTQFERYYAARKQIKTNLFGLLGTRPASIAKILRSKGFQVQSFRPKKAAEAEVFDGVIVLAWYLFGAHYVAGIGKGDGTYTFYNHFSKPCAMTLKDFLENQKTVKQHPIRIWGIRFPEKQEQEQ